MELRGTSGTGQILTVYIIFPEQYKKFRILLNGKVQMETGTWVKNFSRVMMKSVWFSRSVIRGPN